jgi:histidinol-phosphate aminotransferase
MVRVRPTIANMTGYVPGEQPRAGERIVKLNTNENPYPPSPKVLEAVRAIDADSLRRYPNPTADAFRDAAAALFDLTRDHLIAGNGSDDVLAVAVRTFLGPGDVLAYPNPTYSLYPVLAEMHDVRVAEVPWDQPGWRLPIDGLLAARPRAVFFASPNAPTGTPVSLDDIRNLARRFDGLVLVDEAYVDFADGDALPVVRDHDNVLVCRTLSKSYSLAGLRFGYGIGHPSLVAEMMKVKDSYNCDAVSIAAATAALADQDHARATWQAIRAERARLTSELVSRGWEVIPSQTNFVFARPPGGNAGELYRALKAKGILVRYFDKPGLADRLRITVGKPEETDALLGAL